jgi:methyl-accepting chemotaxis protein
MEKATAAYEDATSRAKTVEAEVREAAQAVESAKNTVDEATKELESLLRASPRR